MEQLELDHIASQLKSILAQLHSVESSKVLGSVSEGALIAMSFPHRMWPQNTPSQVSRSLPRDVGAILHGTVHTTESLLPRIPRNAAIKFTHGDLLPKNNIVEGSRITGILDWATGGCYPAYWEYCRMRDPYFMTAGWKLVLQEVFLGEPREREISAVCELLHAVANTLA